MRVTVIGPNLRNQSKGLFHVHAEGCADIAKRYSAAELSESDSAEYATLQELVEDMYDGQLQDDPSATWQEYAPDFHVLPCAAALSATKEV
jgi:hypothetical protein